MSSGSMVAYKDQREIEEAERAKTSKRLKLEVGKTYRTRGGEKVKIVHRKTHSFEGFGRWVVCNDESPSTYAVHDDGKLHTPLINNADLISEDGVLDVYKPCEGQCAFHLSGDGSISRYGTQGHIDMGACWPTEELAKVQRSRVKLFNYLWQFAVQFRTLSSGRGYCVMQNENEIFTVYECDARGEELLPILYLEDDAKRVAGAMNQLIIDDKVSRYL